MANLKIAFNEKHKAQIQKDLGLNNVMQVPRMEKIVINVGLGEALQITGQQPVVTRAKQAISNFKLRAGVPIGLRVTLRGNRMYEFLERLVAIALPRVRDFKGVSPKSFDGRGNYTLGIKEQLIFPEIDYDKIEKIKGMNITLCTTAKTDEEGKNLLSHLGFPFRK